MLERDTIHRFSTERILRREDYWVFVTEDAAAAVRVAAVSAVDLVLVDLGLGLIAAGARRPSAGAETRASTSLPPALGEGYAILRPLHLDPKAQLPIVTLRLPAPSEEPVPACRFALVGLLPRPRAPTGLVEGLERGLRRRALGARRRALPARTTPGGPAASRTATRARPFESTPLPLRTALVADPDPTAAAGARRLPGAPRLHRLRGGERRGRRCASRSRGVRGSS